MKTKYNIKIPSQAKRKDLAILLFILFLVIFTNLIILTFSYFSQNQTATGTIQLGEVDFSIIETEQTNLDVLPNLAFDKTISVGNFRNSNSGDYKRLADIFVRFNLVALLNGEVNSELTNSITLSSDATFYFDNTYYYFCGTLGAGEVVNLCNRLTFKDSIDNKYQQQQIQLQFTVDAVQAQNEAYKEVWPDYPLQWEQSIVNQS